MTRALETTSLLGGPPSAEIRHAWGFQRIALVGLCCVALVVAWKGNLRRDVSLNSADGDVPFDSSRSLDRTSFDRIFHTWESTMYKRTQLVTLEGSAKIPSDNIASDGDKDELIYFNHSQAFELLESTKKSLTRDFYYYQQGWDAQINQAYCGVASSMAAMNSLRGKLTLPQDPVYVPFPWATQLDLMDNDCVRQNLYDMDKMDHMFWGLGLEMAAILLNCHLQPQNWKATAYPVDPSMTSPHEIRSIFIDALHDEDTRLLINYDRGGMTQGPMGHGHFSPIGAYNYQNDAFLVMDVAKYKYPPVWVPTSKLMGGIASLDECAIFTYPEHPLVISDYADVAGQLGCQPSYRGYILITKDNDGARE